MRFSLCLLITWIMLLTMGYGQEDSLQLAKRAYQNRLMGLSKEEFELTIRKSQDPVIRFEAYLGLAKIYLLEGQIEEASVFLAEFPKAPNSRLLSKKILIQADTKLLKAEITDAEAFLAQLPILSGDLDIQRKRLQARILAAQGERPTAIGLLQGEDELAALPLVLQLDVARLLYDTDQQTEAKDIWSRLATGVQTATTTQQSLLQLAKVSLEEGSPDEARIYLEKLTNTPGLKEELEADVYPVLIRLLEKEGLHLQAAEYVQAFEGIVEDSSSQLVLQSLRAQNLILGGEADRANRLLQELIALRGDQPEIAKVQLLLARTFLDQAMLNEAEAAYQTYLSVFSDPLGLLEAETGLATTYEALGEFAKAEVLYEKIRNEAPAGSDLKSLILIKLGDAAFAQGKMDLARTRYQEFLSVYPDHGGVPQVMLQLSVALAESGSLPESMDVLTQIRLRFPQTPPAEKALLQRAILLQRGYRPERALGAYDHYLELYPDGSYVADAMTDKGITAYRLGLFDLALRQFKEVSTLFPDHSRVEQAQSLIGWTHYLMGDDESARSAGRDFLKKYTQSSYAPDVRFWLAEVAYNHGEFPQAATEFQKLAQSATQPLLRAKSHYLAGRSLLADKKLEAALKEFSLSREAKVDATFATDALFYMGDSLTELGKFDEAILVFDQLIREYPDSYLRYPARGRMGDCQYTLGEKDPSRYLEALNSYKLVEESKDTGLMELRLQAMYKVGRTLNALDRKKEGQRQMIKMIQIYMDNRNEIGEEADTWFLRAVADAAQSYEQAGEYREAMKIYELLRNSGLPQAAEGARRYEDLRREHRILF